jgi:hypothetical protein
MLGDERDRRYEQRFEDQEKAVIAALAATQRAINKAEEAAQHEFALLNELRGVVVDRDATFITRSESEAATQRNTERIQELTLQIQGLATRAETVSAYTRVADRVDALEDRFNKSEGRGTGLNAGWLYILGAIAAVGTIISLYLALRS